MDGFELPMSYTLGVWMDLSNVIYIWRMEGIMWCSTNFIFKLIKSYLEQNTLNSTRSSNYKIHQVMEEYEGAKNILIYIFINRTYVSNHMVILLSKHKFDTL